MFCISFVVVGFTEQSSLLYTILLDDSFKKYILIRNVIFYFLNRCKI